MLSQVKRHSMQISLFLFICVIATFAIIEATPRYRQARPQRYEETDFHGRSNGLKSEQYVSNVMDPDAELIPIANSNGGYNNGAVPQNGGGYLGNREFQGGEEQEQGVAVDLDENGYRGRRKYITRYGKHNDRRMKNGYSDEDDSSDSTISTNRGSGYNNGAVPQNGGGYLDNREFQGGEEQGVAEDLDENGYKSRRVYITRYGKHNNRRMKKRYSDKDDSSDSDNSEDNDESNESSKNGCRGCYNNIGNGRKNYNRVYMYD